MNAAPTHSPSVSARNLILLRRASQLVRAGGNGLLDLPAAAAQLPRRPVLPPQGIQKSRHEHGTGHSCGTGCRDRLHTLLHRVQQANHTCRDQVVQLHVLWQAAVAACAQSREPWACAPADDLRCNQQKQQRCSIGCVPQRGTVPLPYLSSLQSPCSPCCLSLSLALCFICASSRTVATEWPISLRLSLTCAYLSPLPPGKSFLLNVLPSLRPLFLKPSPEGEYFTNTKAKMRRISAANLHINCH